MENVRGNIKGLFSLFKLLQKVIGCLMQNDVLVYLKRLKPCKVCPLTV